MKISNNYLKIHYTSWSKKTLNIILMSLKIKPAADYDNFHDSEMQRQMQTT